MGTKINRSVQLGRVLVFVFCLPFIALAQNSDGSGQEPISRALVLEEVVVTATRRQESVRDIPASITALSQQQLIDSGALNAGDIARLVPAFDYTEVNAGQAVLAVRGVQTTAVFGNIQQPVALYYEDVPVLDLTIPWTVPKIQLFDVDRVEVLKGPQGTLFGAGALSGAIRVVNNKPNLSQYEGAVDASVTTTKSGGTGNSVNVMLNAPLVEDKLALRAVGYYEESPGWIQNSVLVDDETNRGESYGSRLAAAWQPTEDFELIATAARTVNKPNDSAYVIYDSESDVSDFQIRTFNNDDSKILNLTANYTMPRATLTSSTSHIDRDATSSIDFSDFAALLTGLTEISPLIDEFKTTNFLQEVRIASNDGGQFQWVVGAFYEDYELDLRETISQIGVSNIPQNFVSGPTFPTDNLEDIRIVTNIEDFAVFGEFSYEFAPNFKLTLGARYSDYSIKVRQDLAITGTTLFDGPPAVVNRSSENDAISPKVSLSYQPNDDLLVYALAARGFRTGNSNLAAPVDPFTGLPIPQAYDPDTLWNYELGFKLSEFDNRLTFDVSVFYIDWEDIQLQVRTESGLPYTDNAGAATSKGAEVSIIGLPARGLELGTTFAYSDATLDSVEPGVPNALIGDQLPGSAKFSAYLYGQYNFSITDSIEALFRLDYSYSGRAFADLGNKDNPEALSYGKNSEIGARLTFINGPYEIGLFVQNLTNDRDRISARDYFFNPVEIRQRPRTIGVNFRARW